MDVELVTGIFIFAFANLVFSLYAKLKFFQVIHKRYPEINNIKEEMGNIQSTINSDVDRVRILKHAKWAVIYNRIGVAVFVVAILIMNIDVLTM